MIKSINANIFSFQDDYIKNMEENMGSDESKSKNRFYLVSKDFSVNV